MESRRVEDEARGLNRELVEARTRELEAARRELEVFTYSVAHDLRAPLHTIDGFTSLLEEQYRDALDDRARDYLRRIHSATRRMTSIIGDILALARLGTALVERQRVDLGALARDILAVLQRAHPERRVVTAVEEGLQADADPALARLLLENLLGNAWKFTARKPVAHIEMGSVERAGERVFFVRDDGAGFDMAYVGRLFQPFQRLHGANEFEGTGVGLASVQRIVSRHGGRAWAEGGVGRGATFHFTL